MSQGKSQQGQVAEQGVPIAEAFRLKIPPRPDRQLDLLLAKADTELSELEKAAGKVDARRTLAAAADFRDELRDLRKKAAKERNRGNLVDEVGELLLAIRAEASSPVRESGVNKVLADFRRHSGSVGREKAEEFAERRDEIGEMDNPKKRCAKYYELERNIIKEDLSFREQLDPGSTWSTRMEFAVEDATPRDLNVEGAKLGAKIGFFVPLPGTTLLGAAVGALSGAILEACEDPPVSLEEWESLGAAFESAMARKIDELAYSTPAEASDQFTQEARRQVALIRERSFSKNKLPETQQQLGKSLMLANTQALQQLLELKRRFPPPSTPSVTVRDGKLTVTKPAPKVESLVLQGGGGKGIGYPAMLEEMNRAGMLDQSDDAIVQRIRQLARKVKHQDFEARDRTDQMITFGDLALLHQLDPKNFKELTITGWEGTGEEGRTVYFTAKDPLYRDMPVALAARISMGLPILSPVYWNGRRPFYDGGLGSNAPVEATPGLDAFYGEHGAIGVEELVSSGEPPVELAQAMQKTMLMTFDDGGQANERLHGQGKLTAAPNLGEKITVLKKGQVEDAINPEYEQALRDDATKTYTSGVNTLQVFHGSAGTLSFGPLAGDPVEVEYAENLARMKGLEQIEQRVDQAVAITCRSADEALWVLNDDEKRAFVNAGPGTDDPLARELHAKCAAYLQLADLAQAACQQGDLTPLLDALRQSPFADAHAAEIGEMITTIRAAAGVGASAAELKSRAATMAAAIQVMPKALQPLLKRALLMPIQRRAREGRRSVPLDAVLAPKSVNRTDSP